MVSGDKPFKKGKIRSTIPNPYHKNYQRQPWSLHITPERLFQEGYSNISSQDSSKLTQSPSESAKHPDKLKFSLGDYIPSSDEEDEAAYSDMSVDTSSEPDFCWKIINIHLPKPSSTEIISIGDEFHVHVQPKTVIICFERSDPSTSKITITNKTGKLSEKINHCDLMHRGTNGWYYFNKANKRPHYEILTTEETLFREEMDKKGKTYQVFGTDKGVHHYQDQGYFFVGKNSKVDLKVLHSLGIEVFLKELLIVEGSAVVGIDENRGNRGYSFGYTGSLCQERKAGEDSAKPILVSGTGRYAGFFLQFSRFVQQIAKKYDLPSPFEGGDEAFSDRRNQFAQKIIDGNILESVSVHFLIHGNTDSNDLLKFHVDSENCPQDYWDGCCVLYKDFWVEEICRWVTMSVVGTSRKSIGDSLIRASKMRDAVSNMLVYVYSLPVHQIRITPGTFQHSKSSCDWFVRDIHCQTTVHLSICINGIDAIDKALSTLKEGDKISRFLVLEMIYAFTRTNNAYRFHKFVRMFIKQGWKNTHWHYWVLPLSDTQTFVGEFLTWMTRDYGSFNGNMGPKVEQQYLNPLTEYCPVEFDNVLKDETEKGNNRGKEGVVRFQSSSNRHQTDFSIWKSLFELNELVDVINASTPSKAKYKLLKEAIEKKTEGVADLLSQKIFILLVLTGLVTDTAWLDFTRPGSERHWEALQKDPWNLNKGQETRLVERISEEIDVPQATAEEIGCKRLKSKESQEVRIKNKPLFGVKYQRIGGKKTVVVFEGIPGVKEEDYEKFHGFAMEESTILEANHYISPWRASGGNFVSTEGKVRMANDVEGVQLLRLGMLKTQKEMEFRYTKDSRKTHSEKGSFSLQNCQVLLNSSACLWLQNPFKLLEQHLGLVDGVLLDERVGIQVKETDSGRFKVTDGMEINQYCDKHSQKLFAESPYTKKPHVNLCQGNPTDFQYTNQLAAKMSLCWYHLLFTKGISGYNWAKRCLVVKKEFLILVPDDTTTCLQKILCTVFWDTLRGPSVKMFHSRESVFLSQHPLPDDGTLHSTDSETTDAIIEIQSTSEEEDRED